MVQSIEKLRAKLKAAAFLRKRYRYGTHYAEVDI
jgi:hypothetical protein